MASPYDAWRNTYGMPGPQDPNRPGEIRASTAPRWEELFRGSDVTAINSNPLVQALQRYTNRAPSGIGEVTRVSPIDGRPVPPEPTVLDNLPPTVQEGIGGLGLLANFLAPGAKLPPIAPKPTGIRAYHGSPHDFDKFDISKIGTGEGAQAYGHGLYFSESPAVARSYEGMLAGNGYDPAVIARDALEAVGRDPVKALAKLTKETPPKMGLPEFDVLADNYGHAADLLRRHMAGEKMPLPARGRMYEVSINADPDRFLDFDAPLNQQPPKAQEALDRIMPELLAKREPMRDRINELLGNPPPKIDPPTSAHDLFGLVKQQRYGTGEIEAKFREAGIPGIRYKDALSRGADGGTSNFVVFDDSLIQILRKYGLLPPAAAAGASLMEQQEPPL